MAQNLQQPYAKVGLLQAVSLQSCALQLARVGLIVLDTRSSHAVMPWVGNLMQSFELQLNFTAKMIPRRGNCAE